MIYHDLLEAELCLYGEYNRNLVIRTNPGGRDHINDLAQAWIDGDRDKVLAYTRAYKARNTTPVNKLQSNIRELRKLGWSTIRISNQIGCSTTYVVRMCRGMPDLKRSARKADATLIHRLHNQGHLKTKIAKELGLSLRTVLRVLKTTIPPTSG